MPGMFLVHDPKVKHKYLRGDIIVRRIITRIPILISNRLIPLSEMYVYSATLCTRILVIIDAPFKICLRKPFFIFNTSHFLYIAGLLLSKKIILFSKNLSKGVNNRY